MTNSDLEPCRLPAALSAAALALAAGLAGGCAAPGDAGVAPSGGEIDWLGDTETIALLRSPRFHFDWTNDERATRIDPIECIRRGLTEAGVGDRLVSEERFVRIAFPDIPPEGAPTDPESIRVLLTHPTLLERIEPLNLRYLVYATSVTEIRNARAVLGGVAGYGGAAVMRWEQWDQSSEFSFVVIDAKAVKQVAAAETREHGSGWQSYGWVVVPFALGYETNTESQACEDVARRVRIALREHGAR